MGISGIILAGGKSQRMGQDKTRMAFNNQTMIERTANELRRVADEIIIAGNGRDKFAMPDTLEVTDIYPGMGPLGGMHAALAAAKHEYAFIVSCDMPLFSAELAALLLARRTDFDVVVPEIRGHLEPLCAVYAKRCLGAIEKCLQADIRQVFQFYPDVRVRKVDARELGELPCVEELFFNLNTPEDYQALLQGKRQPGVKR